MKAIQSTKFLFLLMLVVISSCNSDPEPEENDNQGITEIPEVIITTSISGTVVDEAEEPMENVMVHVAGNTAITDAYGVFSFNDIEANKNGALVVVEEDGYFNNSKVLFAGSNKTSTTKIMLIAKTITSTFDASVGGTSTMNGGAKVEIPAAGVKLESGENYSGNVNVYATYLDPTADDLSLRMPGDLRATNTDQEVVKLVTYGMIGVELEGDGGEALNIADGQKATIEIPVPASLLSSAPSTIPLWHFDEASGYWIEEGEATLTGNKYIGTVSHFSFWNYDLDYPFILIEGKITDAKQAEIGSSRIEIVMESTAETLYGYTDSDGSYKGYVPMDENLTINVFNTCGEKIYSGQIGPFSEDTVVPTIEISAVSGNFLTVLGVLTDCNNEIESNGYVFIDLNGSPYNIVNVGSDGNFNATIDVCDEINVTISGVSNDPFSQGTSTVHNISGLTELNVGTLITCW